MTDDIREAARKRIKGRRDFWTMLLIFIVISAVLNVIWFMSLGSSGSDYYWPLWPMLGFLIATVLAAISTFGPGSKPITDERIDEEIRRMGGSSGPSA
ncbi:MAG TPA: 2TM domain-containing protein [Microbacteriaceae bacterium]|nr:2TM domain-containing protein [Microbacteriaceae bacterium]